ncbi:TPA: hypothetical protein OMS29_004240 [Klebsiella aerogenes]|nr:hypothetical protein [Klebsiella aerogenes]
MSTSGNTMDPGMWIPFYDGPTTSPIAISRTPSDGTGTVSIALCTDYPDDELIGHPLEGGEALRISLAEGESLYVKADVPSDTASVIISIKE